MTYTKFKSVALAQGIRTAMRHAVLGCRITIAQAQLWGMQFRKEYHLTAYDKISTKFVDF